MWFVRASERGAGAVARLVIDASTSGRGGPPRNRERLDEGIAAGDHFRAAVTDEVELREVLVHPHGVEHAQDGDRADEPDPLRAGGIRHKGGHPDCSPGRATWHRASWGYQARGHQSSDSVFSQSGARVYQSVTVAFEPRADETDVITHWTRYGRRRSGFRRLVLPFRSRDQSWVLSGIEMDPTIELLEVRRGGRRRLPSLLAGAGAPAHDFEQVGAAGSFLRQISE